MLRRLILAAFKNENGASTSHAQTPDQAELDSLTKRVSRRQWLVKSIVASIPLVSTLLIVAGYVAGLLLPTGLWSRSTYISENAILPGQVNTYWGWSQVHAADRIADQVDGWRHLPSHERADRIREFFEALGLRSQTQSYVFSSLTAGRQPISNGTNVHAIHHAPRTDGAESLVLMASWLSRQPGSDVRGGDVNVRGVATVLALADYLRTFNLWSKDIIFLIADEFLEGTHAWLKAYHGVSQSNLKTDNLDLRTGPIWAALNIDFPFHSFSHVGIEYEGINGQLPNLDLINTVAHIVRWTGSSPVTIHNAPLEPAYPAYVRDLPKLREYLQAGRTIVRQMSHGLLGTPSGPEGIFTTYRIDAVALFAHPADGPHGFHTIGRIVESSLRSLNNLLERFHQSFFLYLLQSEDKFLSVAMYLIVPLLIGVGLTLKGLAKWGEGLENKQMGAAKDEKWGAEKAGGMQRGGEILWSVRVVGVTHLLGLAAFWSVVRSVEPVDATQSLKLYGLLVFFGALPFLVVKLSPPTRHTRLVFEPIHLMLAGCLVCVISVLNFPLGTGMGVALGSPGGAMVSLLAGFLGSGAWWKQVLVDDQVLESWMLAFWFAGIVPLFVQAGVVRLLNWQVFLG